MALAGAKRELASDAPQKKKKNEMALDAPQRKKKKEMASDDTEEGNLSKENVVSKKEPSDAVHDLKLSKKRISEQEDSEDTLTNQILVHVSEKADLSSTVSRIYAKNSVMESSLIEMSEKLNASKALCQSPTSQESQFVAEKDGLLSQVHNFRDTKKDLEEKRSHLSLERELMQTHLQEVEQLLSSRTKEHERALNYHQYQISMHQAEKADLAFKLKEKEESVSTETKRRRETEELLESYRTELHDIRRSQQKMRTENKELRKQNSELRTKIKELRKQNSELRTKIKELRKQNAELLTGRDKIKKDLEEHLSVECLSSCSHLEVNLVEFDYAELKAATNDFNGSFRIGEGGSGNVYKAFLRHTSVAIKILRRENRHGEKEFNQEVEILSRIKHPNLVMLIGSCPEARALIYELMPNGSLYDILSDKKRSKTLTWKTRICIASNICSALIFLHSAKPHGIVHGDIKSANILLDSNYISKLSDFGICRQLYQTDARITPHHSTEYLRGSRPYMDPEYWNSAQLTAHCDIYSFGIVLLELVTGKGPWGLREYAVNALQKGERFVDTSAGKWSIEEAKKMMLLGLHCCNLSRKNQPDLVKEVWVEIESMMRACGR